MPKTNQANPFENSPYQVIVEGPDDKAFFGSLQTKLFDTGQIQERANIEAKGGKYQLEVTKQYLESLKNRPLPVRGYAIIWDADLDPDAAFSSAIGIFKHIAGLPIPTQIGKFEQNDNCRVGILIVPHDRPGLRETLCLEAINQTLMPCIDDFITCAAEKGFTPHSKEKARLLAYLAAQKETDARTGIAVDKGYIPWDSPAFEIIRRFLIELTATFA